MRARRDSSSLRAEATAGHATMRSGHLDFARSRSDGQAARWRVRPGCARPQSLRPRRSAARGRQSSPSPCGRRCTPLRREASRCSPSRVNRGAAPLVCREAMRLSAATRPTELDQLAMARVRTLIERHLGHMRGHASGLRCGGATSWAPGTAPRALDEPPEDGNPAWARVVSNHRPLACEATRLESPLRLIACKSGESHAPHGGRDGPDPAPSGHVWTHE